MVKSLIINTLLVAFIGSFASCSEDLIEIKGIGPIKGGDYYVATWGSDMNPGTYEKPLKTWQRAFNKAEPGDTVYFRAGTWYPKYGYEIHPEDAIGTSGTAGNIIYYLNYPDEVPILDCKDMVPEYGNINYAIDIYRAQFLYFKGLVIRNIYGRTNPILGTGINAGECANLTFENMIVHDVEGRGCYFASATYPAWRWGAVGLFPAPDTTRFINCDFYNLCDFVSDNPGNAADGVFAQNFEGGYLLFDGCRIWNYADDGVDASGDGVRVFRNCWLIPTNKYSEYGMEGNGLKLSASRYETGSPRDKHLIEVTNCVAAYCKGRGFYLDIFVDHSTHYPTNALIYNNIAYKCEYAGFEEKGVQGYTRTSIYRNNIAIGAVKKEAGYDPIYEVAIYRPSIYDESHNNWVATQLADGWPGWVYSDEIKVDSTDFESVIPNLLDLRRQTDGSLPVTRFLHLKDGSDLINAGIDVGLPFLGTAPDLGPFEKK